MNLIDWENGELIIFTTQSSVLEVWIGGDWILVTPLTLAQLNIQAKVGSAGVLGKHSFAIVDYDYLKEAYLALRKSRMFYFRLLQYRMLQLLEWIYYQVLWLLHKTGIKGKLETWGRWLRAEMGGD